MIGRPRRRRAAWPLVAVLGFLAAAASSQEGPEARPGDTLGIHVVASGETLSAITMSYLGTSTLWRENLRLNPSVTHPDRLSIGQRLRVITDRVLPERHAEVVEISRRVDKILKDQPEEPAILGDVLAEEDGLRTYRRSSAALEFDDGARLQVTEQSLVIVRAIGAKLTGVKQQTIEIVDGAADLLSTSPLPRRSEIEIVIGDARTRPQLGDGASQHSSRLKNDGGRADIMVYNGATSVSAAGADIAVPTGMGTSVVEGQAPNPPERLLKAPSLVAPASGTRFDYSNPLFSWRPVSGAVSYQIEICRDAECAELIDRQTDVGETTWRPEDRALPAGSLFWRARAAATSGLDGYASRARPFTITNEAPDLSPPAVVLAVAQPGTAIDNARVVLAPGGSVSLHASDDASGVTRLEYRWNGGRWRDGSNQRIVPPNAGTHQLEWRAADEVGRESQIWQASIELVAEPPSQPAPR